MLQESDTKKRMNILDNQFQDISLIWHFGGFRWKIENAVISLENLC